MTIIFRLIQDKDQEKPFTTSRESFNKENPSETLKEFYHKSSKYKTFVLEKDNKIIGIARYKEEKYRIGKFNQIFYISRVGVKKGFENKGYGKLMYTQITNKIFEMIDFSKSFCIYFSIPEEDITFWINYLKKIRDLITISQIKYDEIWGNYYIIKIISKVNNKDNS